MIIESSIENDKSIIHLWNRDSKKKIYKKIEDFQPYFFALSNDNPEGISHLIISEEEGYKTIYNDEVKKVFVKNHHVLRKVASFFKKDFEADVRYITRYLADNIIDFGEIPKILYVDIEVDVERGSFPEPSEAKFPIVSITLASNYSEKYITLFLDLKKEFVEETFWTNRLTGVKEDWSIYFFNDEKKLLKKFLELFQLIDADILTGWNSTFFDYPYIIKRMENLNVDYNMLSPLNNVFIKPPSIRLKSGKREDNPPVIKGRLIFDLLPAYRKMSVSELQSKSLGNVGEFELGVKKVAYLGNIFDLYKKNPDKMLEYNCGDVELVKFIDEKVGIIKYFWELSKFIGCRIEDTLSASRMIDVLMLKYKKEYDNKVLPSKSSTKPQTFQGAFVKDPEIGLYNNVIVLDLNKLYPSIITTFHFSPNTILLPDYEGDCITLPNGLKFSKKEKGFTPQILEKLFHIRSFYEEEKEKFEEDTREWEIANNNRQFAKDLCNSFYGILSYSGCRCYVPEVGASITLMGREIIKATIEFVEKLGYKVIYSDTDSIFLLGKSVGEESLFREGFLVEEKLNSFYPEFVKKYGVDDSSISISLEKIYEKFLILAKKRYSGFLYKKGRLESKGIETRRSDSSKFTKNILNDLLVGVLVTGWD